ncbi:D-glycero-alpha-D-manno-heptose-1,7-bisphosphate 7-phosphatase [Phreatobacter stygius]|uniref:D-glycero-alpha-D-manno-heptose-1,7-bisphosphate 7-phosphatase n=1 Tax=Phreatobacter stygius TaxID=1940610 RepID=UPI001477209C|nr:HAD family hydrolase [Phreatobacter stygius]
MHPLESIGLWAQQLTPDLKPNRPALFLDRDGVVVEEVHFLRRIEDVRLSFGVAEAIARVNAGGIPVVIVTNQSGIARGHFGWEEFATVQAEIIRQLATRGARLDAVLACAYHGSGIPPFDVDECDWRKPGPGMLFAARDRMELDLARSVIIGDRLSDLEAGRNAGLRSGTLVLTGYGAENVRALEDCRFDWARNGYETAIAEGPAAAIEAALRQMSA